MINGSSLLVRRLLPATVLSAVMGVPILGGLQAGELDLKLRLQQGSTYHQTLDATLETWQGPAAEEQLTRVQTGIGLSYRVQTVAPGTGDMDVRMTYEWVTMRVNSAAATINFDSRITPGESHPETRVFAALAGQGVHATLNSDGRVAAIRGVEEMQKSMVDKLAPSAGPERQLLEAVIAQQFGRDTIRATIEGSFTLPGQSVAQGESWRSRVPPPAGTKMDLENVYTLRQRHKGAATIDVTADLSLRPGRTGGINGSLTGSQAGHLVIDEATGWTTASHVVQEMSGSVGGVMTRIKTIVTVAGR